MACFVVEHRENLLYARQAHGLSLLDFFLSLILSHPKDVLVLGQLVDEVHMQNRIFPGFHGILFADVTMDGPGLTLFRGEGLRHC